MWKCSDHTEYIEIVRVSVKKMLAYPAFGLRNKYLENVDDDFLYHFGFGLKTVDIPKIFGDTKVSQRGRERQKEELRCLQPLIVEAIILNIYLLRHLSTTNRRIPTQHKRHCSTIAQ